MINWHGIEISIHTNDVPHNYNEYENNGKVLKDMSYRPHTRESTANHKNAEHLDDTVK